MGRTIYRNGEVRHSECMTELALEMYQRGIKGERAISPGDALVSRGRSILASAFLRSDCDVLLSIDGDIEFEPEDAIRLAEECDKGFSVIGALYMTRALGTQPAMMLPADEEVEFRTGAKPVEVPFVSTGFLAVHRKVFEELRQDLPLCHQGWQDKGVSTAFWPFYMPFVIPWEGDDGFMYLSEDWAFCERARQHGYKIWLDPGVRLGHVGESRYQLEDLFHKRPEAAPIRLRREQDGTLHSDIAQVVTTRKEGSYV